MRASGITKLPVVTHAGEDVAQIKDLVYSADGGAVAGFTLAGRGLLAGPLKTALSWSRVAALGADAVMVESDEVLEPVDELLRSAASSSGGSGGNVLGSRVLTDAGADLGEVTDVIVAFRNDPSTSGTDTPPGHGSPCDVIGYEIEASEGLRATHKVQGTKLLVPLPDTLAVSGEHLIVPESAAQFVREDLAGFGAAVEEFRTQLGERS